MNLRNINNELIINKKENNKDTENDVILVTGTCSYYKRDELIKLLKANGCKVETTFSTKVNTIFAFEKASPNKLILARTRKLKIINMAYLAERFLLSAIKNKTYTAHKVD